MTLHLQPKALADALNRVVNAIERRTIMPILSHVLMSARGGKLTLRGTDLDTEIETHLDCEGEIEDTCAPADRLQAALARLAERGEVSISVDGQSLTMASGRARFTMPVLLAEGFPSLKNEDVGCAFTMEGKALATLFGACGFAMANSSDRYYLNGVLLFGGTIGSGKGKSLCGIATDGHKLSAREVTADLPSDFPQVIVPRKAVLSLGKMVEGWSEIAIEISQSRFIVTFGPTRFVTKLVEGTYPDWRRVIPELEPAISYDAEQMSTAVATAYAAVQSDKKSGALKLAFSEAETEFSTRSTDGAAAGSDACPHSQMAEPAASEIGLNPKYLLETLSALDAETVEIAFGEAGSAIVLTAAALADRKAVIMPMRV